MNISTNFDSGNIKVIDCSNAQNIQLEIEKDTYSDFYQWFHFRVQNVKEEECVFRLINAKDSAYPEGWEHYHAVASYDGEEWFRVPTTYKDGELIITHTPHYNAVYYAYFAPYSYERHRNLIHVAQLSERCVATSIGQTTQGREIDLLTIGEPADNKRKIWLLARQHPGESMAEWFIEGFIERLLNYNDPISKMILDKAVFYIVPNVNVDGSILGNLRTNALGVNLNREWQSPSLEKSPEVYYVKQKMQELGCDMNLDIHGDEALPYNFISANEGLPGYSDRMSILEDRFCKSWKRVSPDFQTEHGYPKSEPGKANLMVCAKQLGQLFDCLSLTIEMPFKDNKDNPDPVYGWSPERSKVFGASVLNAIWESVDYLR